VGAVHGRWLCGVDGPAHWKQRGPLRRWRGSALPGQIQAPGALVGRPGAALRLSGWASGSRLPQPLAEADSGCRMLDCDALRLGTDIYAAMAVRFLAWRKRCRDSVTRQG